jgi:hypothetical protein
MRHMAGLVPPGGNTMETGAGVSTVFFAMCGFRHTAIAPDPELFERIGRFAADHGIDMAQVEFVVERSEAYLPRARLPELDLFLIDGRHAFPTPFIDWYYAAEALRIDGLVAVDDTQILTGRILADFLASELHWDNGTTIGKTAVFRKLDAHVHDGGWQTQPLLQAFDDQTSREGRYLRKMARWVKLLRPRGT